MIRKVTVPIAACGECPKYNWHWHECDMGATKKNDVNRGFYEDCPLEHEDILIETKNNIRGENSD